MHCVLSVFRRGLDWAESKLDNFGNFVFYGSSSTVKDSLLYVIALIICTIKKLSKWQRHSFLPRSGYNLPNQ